MQLVAAANVASLIRVVVALGRKDDSWKLKGLREALENPKGLLGPTVGFVDTGATIVMWTKLYLCCFVIFTFLDGS